MIIIVRFQPGEWSLISHNMFWEISKPPQLARLSLEISIWDKIFTSICHQSQPLPHLVIRWRQTGGADCENWWHEARPSTHLEWDNFYNQTEFLRLQSRRVMKRSSLLPAWYDLAHSLNTFILLYLLKVTINIWSRLWRRIVGLDRISLKPILSLWSGNTGAGSDGKLFVVKLISLLSLHPCLPPNTPPATIKSCRSQEHSWVILTLIRSETYLQTIPHSARPFLASPHQWDTVWDRQPLGPVSSRAESCDIKILVSFLTHLTTQ